MYMWYCFSLRRMRYSDITWNRWDTYSRGEFLWIFVDIQERAHTHTHPVRRTHYRRNVYSTSLSFSCSRVSWEYFLNMWTRFLSHYDDENDDTVPYAKFRLWFDVIRDTENGKIEKWLFVYMVDVYGRMYVLITTSHISSHILFSFYFIFLFLVVSYFFFFYFLFTRYLHLIQGYANVENIIQLHTYQMHNHYTCTHRNCYEHFWLFSQCVSRSLCWRNIYHLANVFYMLRFIISFRFRQISIPMCENKKEKPTKTKSTRKKNTHENK